MESSAIDQFRSRKKCGAALSPVLGSNLALLNSVTNVVKVDNDPFTVSTQSIVSVSCNRIAGAILARLKLTFEVTSNEETTSVLS